MAQNLSGFDAALKIDYLPAIREQLNNATILLSKVERNERDVSGKRWQTTAHYQRNSGVGAGGETDLPTAGNQGYVNPYGVVKYNRGRIQVSGPVIAASRDDKGAMVRALDSEIKGVTADLKKEINYQLFNDGTAVRALVNTDPGAAGTTLTLDSPGTQYLQDGMKIDILNPSGGTSRLTTSGLTVSSVNSSTEATISAADADIADNDYVTRLGATNLSGTSYEMNGLKGIVDDATYVTTLHNLSRSTYAWWKCATHSDDDNSGTNRDLTKDLMQASITAVEKLGGEVDMILCDHDLRDSYAALEWADKRHVNTMKIDGGWTALEFNSLPIVADVDCPPNTMFFIDTKHLQIMQMGDWDWMDKDGAVLSRVSGSDAYEAVVYWYADLVTDRPRSHSFLRDVQ